jgi:hypothetical protein
MKSDFWALGKKPSFDTLKDLSTYLQAFSIETQQPNSHTDRGEHSISALLERVTLLRRARQFSYNELV